MAVLGIEASLSVTDASRLGVAKLVANAERGAAVIVSRRGTPAAVVVGVRRLESILRREDDLRSAALVLARAATDAGGRTTLDEAITAFGFDRAELEAELDAELDAEQRS
jgi:prevent-host-death family protein